MFKNLTEQERLWVQNKNDERSDQEAPTPGVELTKSSITLSPSRSGDEAEADVHPMSPPPRSQGEQVRDGILNSLDGAVAQCCTLLLIVLVVISAGCFFFLLIGAQPLCRPRLDCEPRNYLLNLSLNILNGSLTAMTVLSLPWRLAQFIHCLLGYTRTKPRNKSLVGHNLHGQQDEDIWYAIAPSRRLGIIICLLLNVVSQALHQTEVLYYYSYELKYTDNGVLWTNIFWPFALGFAAMAGLWIALETKWIHQAHPGVFGLGPVDWGKSMYTKHIIKSKHVERLEI